MSWDAHIYLDVCPHCRRPGDTIELGNYTHNTNPMVRRALAAVGRLDGLGGDHLYALDGMRCGDVAALLMPAIEWWLTADMSDLEPENGWGNAPGALVFWSRLAQMCADNPDGQLRLSG